MKLRYLLSPLLVLHFVQSAVFTRFVRIHSRDVTLSVGNSTKNMRKM